MAYWLKAAEDLFEVVDRRAKLAVGDQPDEPPNTVSPASNGQGVQPKRTRSKAKIQKLIAVNKTTATLDTAQEATSSETQADVAADKEKVTSSIENTTTTNDEQQSDKIDEDATSTATPSLTISSNNDMKPESPDHGGADTAVPVITELDADVIADTPSEVREEVLNSPIKEKGIEVVMDDAIPDLVSSVDINMEESSSFDPSVENQTDQKKNPEQKDVDSPKKVQEQLDEAQGLLKSAISTGPSKEARLARVCAGLSSRLQEYKSENGQLEELLMAERELSKSYETHIQQLQRDLSASKSEIDRVESHMVEALAAKNSEIETLVSSTDALKKQAAMAEGNLASLQANMESLMRSRELAETRMMQALREELASVERRAEEERAAHNASKKAAMEREVELERHALDASTALARTQRIADERTTKAAELEQKVALLEVECASLNQELQDMEARSRREHKKSPEESNQVIQMQAWQEEVERAHQGQRDAESTLSSLEAELQKMRIEMAAMKRDAEHYSRQEHTELEKRYRELTDLLYYKQTQLEAMASEKAAAEFQLEKETKRIREVQIEVEKSRATRRGSASWEEDTDMKALEPLPLHHRHLAVAGVQLQKVAKVLDSAAVRATRFLWRYPVARVLLLCYMVFVHFFLMYLLHRLQEQADTFANLELAQSMGLGNHTFT